MQISVRVNHSIMIYKLIENSKHLNKRCTWMTNQLRTWKSWSHHGQVCLTTGTRKGGRNISLAALWVRDAENL